MAVSAEMRGGHFKAKRAMRLVSKIISLIFLFYFIFAVYLDGLGPIAENETKTSNLGPLNDALRGFAALQASKRHLPKALGLPSVSKQHLPRGLGVPRGWALPSFSKRHPPGIWAHFKNDPN